MSDILDEASAVVQCKECPWYKSCVAPMRFTMEDLKRQLNLTMPQAGLQPWEESGMSKLLGDLASATQNLLLESCPIFIQRLRTSPKLAERIKKMMQSWGEEEKTD